MSADIQADCAKVLTALEGAVRLARTDISYKVFHRHRTMAQLDAIAEALETQGLISRIEIPPSNGHDSRIEVWEAKAISQSAGSVNGAARPAEGPPPGEGWVSKTKTLRRAQRGVVPAVAARAGRIERKKDRARRGTAKAGVPRVSDEQRGATRLVGMAYRGYREQGIIEEQGEWIRLVKNPTHRPPRATGTSPCSTSSPKGTRPLMGSGAGSRSGRSLPSWKTPCVANSNPTNG